MNPSDDLFGIGGESSVLLNGYLARLRLAYSSIVRTCRKGCSWVEEFSCEKPFFVKSSLGGADTLARIPGDGYKGGREMDCTRRPGMDVDSSATD